VRRHVCARCDVADEVKRVMSNAAERDTGGSNRIADDARHSRGALSPTYLRSSTLQRRQSLCRPLQILKVSHSLSVSVSLLLSFSLSLSLFLYPLPLMSMHMWGHVCDTCAGSSGIEAFFHAIPGIGESCAKCIAKEYPCLRALVRKYQGFHGHMPPHEQMPPHMRIASAPCHSRQHGIYGDGSSDVAPGRLPPSHVAAALPRQAPHVATHDAHAKTDALDMLQDLRFAGQAACARTARLGEASQRVGQARSQRIHLLFHSRDPATVISTKKDEERNKDRTCV
jgi:hypothetical protein